MTSPQDLVTGVDCTGLLNIDQATLNNLVNQGTPFTDKGLTILTKDTDAGNPDVPDARDGQGNEKWQRYLWIRQQAKVASLYIWDNSAASDGIMFKWKFAAIMLPDGSVTTEKLAQQAVTEDKIKSVNWAQLTDVPQNGFIPGGNAGGALNGTYPNPGLNDGAVTVGKIALEAVQNAALSGSNGGPPCVDIAKNIIVNGVWPAKALVRVNNAATGLIAETKLITQLAEPAAGNALQTVQVNANGSGFQYSAHGLLQKVVVRDTATDNDGGASTGIASVQTAPDIAKGKNIPGLSLNFNPLSAGSTIFIRVVMNVGTYYAAAANTVWAALFNGNACIAADGHMFTQTEQGLNYTKVILEAVLNPGSVAALNLTVRYGRVGATGTSYYNSYNSGATTLTLGGLVASSITIEEYL